MQKTFQVTFDLDEKIEELFDYNSVIGKPEWYIDGINNIEWRVEQMLEDDLDKCDPNVERVVLDHMNYIQFGLENTVAGRINLETKMLEDKVNTIFENIRKTYMEMIDHYHADLIADGETVP